MNNTRPRRLFEVLRYCVIDKHTVKKWNEKESCVKIKFVDIGNI